MEKEIIVLPGVREFHSDYDDIEAEIIKVFREEIYKPLIHDFDLPDKSLTNSQDDLMDAIRRGRVVFYRGVFRGKFNASLSRDLKKLGANFDKKSGTFKIHEKKLPEDIVMTIKTADSSFNRLAQKINSKLEGIFPEKIAEKMRFKKLFDSVIFKVNTRLKKRIEAVSFYPTLTDQEKKMISEGYTKDLKRYIQNFTEQEINKLREKVRRSTMAGNRYDSLLSSIQHSYGVSVNKARFLARQETNLMMTKFKESRYKSAGITEYIWTCVHMPHDTSPSQHTPGNVRYYHAKLNGTRQKFDNPPVTSKDGKRNNPGEDYNCRCIARPVVLF